MKVYVNKTSKVYILGNDGIRLPDISEVNIIDQKSNKIYFSGPIKDQTINQCSCKNDEIMIEKTKDDVLKISVAYNVPHDLYKELIKFAIKGDFRLEIIKCENLDDLFFLDKIVESYKKTLAS